MELKKQLIILRRIYKSLKASKYYIEMRYDLIIIGGGIVGLATALRVLEQKPNLKVMILEKESSIGQH